MSAQYKFQVTTQYESSNGYGRVWRAGSDKPVTVTVEGNDYEDAKANATAMLMKLRYGWRYSFETLEVIQIPTFPTDSNDETFEGVLHS